MHMVDLFYLAPDSGATGGETAPVAGERAAEVVYGVQPDTAESGQPEAGAEPEKAEETKRDKKAEWRKLIEGDYKDEFQNHVQGIINKRFRDTKSLQEQNAALGELAVKLADRYGVDPRDLKGLSEAIDGDKGFLRDQADKAGLTVDQYRESREMRRENEYYRRLRQEQEEQARAQEIQAQWQEQERALKEVYPNFDLNNELNDPNFVNLLKSGIPMEKAYQVTHYDELMGGALKYAVDKTKAQVADNIRARGMRPLEGAVNGAAAAVTVKSDVRKLTKQDREEIARQVMRGKTITFS